MSEPIDTVNQLVLAINRRDVDTALGFYEPDAVLVIQPGQVAREPPNCGTLSRDSPRWSLPWSRRSSM
jgi:ketosteroid isomerase-like protein